MPVQTGTCTSPEDLLDQLRDFATSSNWVTSVVVSAQGTSGYAIGDTLRVDGGTFLHGHQATVRVTAVNGSNQVTAVKVIDAGTYTTLPTNPAATTILTGSGVGAVTLTLTGTASTWSDVRDQTLAAVETDAYGNSQELVLDGTATSGEDILVGYKTYRVFDDNPGQSFLQPDVAGVEVAVMLGHPSAATAWASLTNISPGRAGAHSGGSLMPMMDTGVTQKFWFFVKQNRIFVVVKPLGGRFSWSYAGQYNRNASAVDIPDPLVVMGSTSRDDCGVYTRQLYYTGPFEMIEAEGTAANGRVLVPDTTTWRELANSEVKSTGPVNTHSTGFVHIYPAGKPYNSEGTHR